MLMPRPVRGPRAAARDALSGRLIACRPM